MGEPPAFIVMWKDSGFSDPALRYQYHYISTEKENVRIKD
jgi:hypothetical protein